MPRSPPLCLDEYHAVGQQVVKLTSRYVIFDTVVEGKTVAVNKLTIGVH